MVFFVAAGCSFDTAETEYEVIIHHGRKGCFLSLKLLLLTDATTVKAPTVSNMIQKQIQFCEEFLNLSEGVINTIMTLLHNNMKGHTLMKGKSF